MNLSQRRDQIKRQKQLGDGSEIQSVQSFMSKQSKVIDLKTEAQKLQDRIELKSNKENLSQNRNYRNPLTNSKSRDDSELNKKSAPQILPSKKRAMPDYSNEPVVGSSARNT